MQIFKTRLYKTQLLTILKHISEDKISASENFQHKISILKIFNKNKPS